MPQLDFVSFHYMLSLLSFSYLFVYVTVILFCLKPIFHEFFYKASYPMISYLEYMLLFCVYKEKIVCAVLSCRISAKLRRISSRR
jgi:uncharacterized membrane protein